MAERATTATDPRVTGLTAHTPLGLADRAVALHEITGRAFVGVVVADDATRDRLARRLDGPLPAVGHSRVAATGERLLRLEHDRVHVAFARPADDDPERALHARLDDGGEPHRLNDLSDAHVTLRLEGAATRRALERVCPLDTHPDVFPVGAVARSLAEHLSVIVLREDEHVYTLLSPRSTARDFLHEIATAIRHVGGAPDA